MGRVSGESRLNLLKQPRSSQTLEVELRPWVERVKPAAGPGLSQQHAPSRCEAQSAGCGALHVWPAFALLMTLVTVPLFSTVLPPLFDYPNHLARLHLLLEGGNAFYAVRWRRCRTSRKI